MSDVSEIVMIVRFTGPVPSDAVVIKCDQCKCDGLCRPEIERDLAREERRTGKRLTRLCNVCARPHVMKAMLGRGLRVECIPTDAASAVEYIDGLSDECKERN